MRHMGMHLVLCFTKIYLNSIRIFYAIRQRIPFIQPQMLFEDTICGIFCQGYISCHDKH